MTIRETLPEDTDALVTLASGTGVFKPHELVTLRELLGDFHGGVCEGHFARTLTLAETIAGFVYFAPTPMTLDTWHLYWIAIDSTRHVRGLGTELLKHVEASIRDANGRLLIVETSGLPMYELTRRFYSKHGYEQAGTVRDFYADGDDLVIFRKRLAPG